MDEKDQCYELSESGGKKTWLFHPENKDSGFLPRQSGNMRVAAERSRRLASAATTLC